MSIRRIVNVVLSVTTCFAVGGAILLMVLTSRQHEAADELRLSLQRVQLAEHARVDLLEYVRDSDLAVLGDEREESRRAELERALHAQLAEIQRTARGATERRLAVEAADRLTQYIAARRAAEARHDQLSAVMRDTAAPREAVLRALARLSELNADEAERAFAASRRSDQLSNVIGVTVMVLLVGLVPAALWWLSARVLRPLVSMAAVMERYAAGAQDARAPVMPTAELQQIAQSFNTLADSLRDQHDRQATSIAGIAHDLRTPLNALRLAATAADHDSSPHVTARAFEIVRRQTDRLERMVADLLDSAYIESGQMELRMERCDLRVPVSNAFDLYAASSPRHRLRLTLPPSPVSLMGDRLRLEQVVINLVSNAIKYSPEGGAVDVELRVEQDTAAITVADEGIGIPTASMPRLFEPFQRATRAREDIPGTGLGLSVSRRIVEAHGGQITVFSVEQRGSIFRVSLPCSGVDFDRAGDAERPRRLHAAGGE